MAEAQFRFPSLQAKMGQTRARIFHRLLQARLFRTPRIVPLSGAVPVPFNAPLVGQFTQDKDGDVVWNLHGHSRGSWADRATCPSHTTTSLAKSRTMILHTGSGDKSYTDYIGGKCRGTKFDGTGATVNNTSMIHFVASDNGERVDLVVTNVTDSVGDIGAFNLTGFNLKQK